MPETSGKWASHQKAPTFVPSSTGMGAEDLKLLLKGHRFTGSGKDVAPNRSGSAPPSMEGSFLAIDNLLSRQNAEASESLESLNISIGNYESEEQLRADPAYFSYYCSNVNLNPRLPPPLISWENRRLVRHIGSFGNNWGLTSVDDSGNVSLHFSQGSLPTHKEEPEDEQPSQQPSNSWVDRTSEIWSGQENTTSADQHKAAADSSQVKISYFDVSFMKKCSFLYLFYEDSHIEMINEPALLYSRSIQLLRWSVYCDTKFISFLSIKPTVS